MPWIASKPRVRWTSTRSSAAPRVTVDKPVDWRELAHPDLVNLSDDEFKRRTDWLSRLFYVARANWINWYGDVGMYATQAQYDVLPKVETDIKIGPS